MVLKFQNGAAHLGLAADRQHPCDDAVPLRKALGRRLLEDAHRLATADHIARQETLPDDYTAHLVEAGDRGAKGRDVGARRRGFLPAPPLQVVVRDVASVGKRSGDKVLERAAPERHEPVVADEVGKFPYFEIGP
jgi:hypothetical protein